MPLPLSAAAGSGGCLLPDAVAAGYSEAAGAVPEPVQRSIADVRGDFPPEIPDGLAVGGLMVWTYLMGAVSFELFGHRHNVIADDAALRKAFFTEEMTRIARMTGIVTPS